MFSQTRARAASSVPAATFSFFISCSARSTRSSAIASLLLPSPRAFAPRTPPHFAALARVFLRGALPRRGALAFHFGLQPNTDPMQPDGHVVLLHLEHSSQLFD